MKALDSGLWCKGRKDVYLQQNLKDSKNAVGGGGVEILRLLFGGIVARLCGICPEKHWRFHQDI